MNKRLIGLLAGATMLVACGSDNNTPTTASVCSRVGTVWSGMTGKLTACPNTAAALAGFTVPTGNDCTTKIAACSSSDIPKLDTFLTCLNNLPTCTSSTESTWLITLTSQCYTPLTTGSTAVTQACISSLGLLPAAP